MNDTKRESIDGGCACGDVRYRMAGKPMFVHCCHCTWCQRETGSAFAVNAMIESDNVVLLNGELETIHTASLSGKGQKIIRCQKCHVALWSHYAGEGDTVSFVRVGTLDESHRVPPDVHIYISTKQPWVILPSDKPVFSEYYNARELWPEDSLIRFRALKS